MNPFAIKVNPLFVASNVVLPCLPNKIKAKCSRDSRVMIGHTNKQTKITTLFVRIMTTKMFTFRFI